jgi:hypothetical protein
MVLSSAETGREKIRFIVSLFRMNCNCDFCSAFASKLFHFIPFHGTSFQLETVYCVFCPAQPPCRPALGGKKVGTGLADILSS